MNKKDVLKVLDIAGLFAVVLASLLVLIFEFTGTSILVKYAIAFYVAGFAIATVYFSIMTYNAFKTNNKEQLQEAEIETNQNDEAITKEDKPQAKKSTLIVKLVLCSIALIFTAIVLFLY